MPHIELKGKYKLAIGSGNVRTITMVTDIFIDGNYLTSYGMENKLLLTTYHTRALQAEQYKPLLEAIINLAKTVTPFKGACDNIPAELLQFLTGKKRDYVFEGLKFLQSHNFITKFVNTGRSAEYHIEVISRDEHDNEKDNELVLFLPDNLCLASQITTSKEEVATWYNITKTVGNNQSLLAKTVGSTDCLPAKTVGKTDCLGMVGKTDGLETIGKTDCLGILGENAPKQSEKPTPTNENNIKKTEKPTVPVQIAYRDTVNPIVKPNTEDKSIPIGLPSGRLGVIESPFNNPVDNAVLTSEEIETLPKWQKVIIEAFKFFNRRDFGHDDLKELNKLHAIAEPWQIREGVQFAGLHRIGAFTQGGMRYVTGMFESGWFKGRRPSTAGSARVAGSKKLKDLEKEYESITDGKK